MNPHCSIKAGFCHRLWLDLHSLMIILISVICPAFHCFVLRYRSVCLCWQVGTCWIRQDPLLALYTLVFQENVCCYSLVNIWELRLCERSWQCIINTIDQNSGKLPEFINVLIIFGICIMSLPTLLLSSFSREVDWRLVVSPRNRCRTGGTQKPENPGRSWGAYYSFPLPMLTLSGAVTRLGPLGAREFTVLELE